MSDPVRPHRRQPTRLPRPWDSPGKNTGVGCHFLLQRMKVKSESEVAQSCRPSVTPWTAAYQAPPYTGFSRQEYWSGVPLPSPKKYVAIYVYVCVCTCSVASVVSDSVRPHRRPPTRLLCPWDSPGTNTGVGCHFLLQCMKVESESESEVAQSCLTLSDPMDCSLPGSSIHGSFQTRVLEWVAIAFSHHIAAYVRNS